MWVANPKRRFVAYERRRGHFDSKVVAGIKQRFQQPTTDQPSCSGDQQVRAVQSSQRRLGSITDQREIGARNRTLSH